MAKIEHEMIADLDKETVTSGRNTRQRIRPLVLPAKFPNLS